MAREKIKKFVSLYLRQRFVTDEMPEDECDKEAEFIMRYLHSQGVVIEVEKELPDCDAYRYIDLDNSGWTYNKELMAKTCPMADRVATEPLIEESNG